MHLDHDLERLAAWRDGDRKAADELLSKYYGLVRRTVATKTPENAVDDMVQSVFVALTEGRDRIREGTTFKAYLLSITRNKIADYYRKKDRRATTDRAEVLNSSIRALGAGPSTILLKKENNRLLLEALRGIPLDDQFLLELYYWEDLSAPELGEVLDITLPATRSRIRRAKERLNVALQQLSRKSEQLADTLTDLDAWAKALREELQPYLKGRSSKPAHG